MKHLEGTWSVTTLETEGNKIPSGMIGESKIIVNGDRFTTVAMGSAYSGKMRVDESVTPHTLDLLFDEGPHAGKASLAIYKMSGDSWTICLGFAGNQRPTAFKTTPGSGHALETLARESSATAVRGKLKTPKSATTNADRSQADNWVDESKFPEEMAKLRGEWSAQSIIMNGQPLPNEYLKVGRRIATGVELKVTMAGQIQVHTGFVVDPTQTPRHINYFDMKNPQKGFTHLGIYELEGAVLSTCMGGKGAPRPDSFESTNGDARTLSVWKKIN